MANISVLTQKPSRNRNWARLQSSLRSFQLTSTSLKGTPVELLTMTALLETNCTRKLMRWSNIWFRSWRNRQLGLTKRSSLVDPRQKRAQVRKVNSRCLRYLALGNWLARRSSCNYSRLNNTVKFNGKVLIAKSKWCSEKTIRNQFLLRSFDSARSLW